jgi:hypothetical protein
VLQVELILNVTMGNIQLHVYEPVLAFSEYICKDALHFTQKIGSVGLEEIQIVFFYFQF